MNTTKRIATLMSLLLAGILVASVVFLLGGAPLVSANGVSVNTSHPDAVVIPDHGQDIMWGPIHQINSTTALYGVYSNGTLVGTIEVPNKCTSIYGGVCTGGGVMRTDEGGMAYIYAAPTSWEFPLDMAVANASAIVQANSSIMSTLGGNFYVASGVPDSFNSQTGAVGSVITLYVLSPNGHFTIVVDLSQRQVRIIQASV
jgi:hypothetical protein